MYEIQVTPSSEIPYLQKERSAAVFVTMCHRVRTGSRLSTLFFGRQPRSQQQAVQMQQNILERKTENK